MADQSTGFGLVSCTQFSMGSQELIQPPCVTMAALQQQYMEAALAKAAGDAGGLREHMATLLYSSEPVEELFSSQLASQERGPSEYEMPAPLPAIDVQQCGQEDHNILSPVGAPGQGNGHLIIPDSEEDGGFSSPQPLPQERQQPPADSQRCGNAAAAASDVGDEAAPALAKPGKVVGAFLLHRGCPLLSDSADADVFEESGARAAACSARPGNLDSHCTPPRPPVGPRRQHMSLTSSCHTHATSAGATAHASAGVPAPATAAGVQGGSCACGAEQVPAHTGSSGATAAEAAGGPRWHTPSTPAGSTGQPPHSTPAATPMASRGSARLRQASSTGAAAALGSRGAAALAGGASPATDLRGVAAAHHHHQQQQQQPGAPLFSASVMRVWQQACSRHQ